ncbi:MAG: PASTA domain-containing protein [Tissierellia bacterium]|nr:PASTA domain-containing protein [Tissierellia bacterium]
MEDAGLSLEVHYEDSDKYEKDRVFWQEIERGKEIEKGTTVTVYVSSNKIEVSEGPVEGNEEISVAYSVEPDQSKEYMHVVIYKSSSSGEEIVFDKMIYHDTEVQNIVLKGNQGDVFKVYHDDVLIRELR